MARLRAACGDVVWMLLPYKTTIANRRKIWTFSVQITVQLALDRSHKEGLCGQSQLPDSDPACRAERGRDLQPALQPQWKIGGAIALPQQVPVRLLRDL